MRKQGGRGQRSPAAQGRQPTRPLRRAREVILAHKHVPFSQQGPDHRQDKRALAVEHLRGMRLGPDQRGEVLLPQAADLHDMLDRRDRIRRLYRKPRSSTPNRTRGLLDRRAGGPESASQRTPIPRPWRRLYFHRLSPTTVLPAKALNCSPIRGRSSLGISELRGHRSERDLPGQRRRHPRRHCGDTRRGDVRNPGRSSCREQENSISRRSRTSSV